MWLSPEIRPLVMARSLDARWGDATPARRVTSRALPGCGSGRRMAWCPPGRKTTRPARRTHEDQGQWHPHQLPDRWTGGRALGHHEQLLGYDAPHVGPADQGL